MRHWTDWRARRLWGGSIVVALVVLFAYASWTGEIRWLVANAQSDLNGLRSYLVDFPDGERAAQAKTSVRNLEFADAMALGTERALAEFEAKYPRSELAQRADSAATELRFDHTIYEKLRASSPSKADIERFIEDFPGHVDASKARELLRRREGVPIFELVESGLVEVEARGAGISKVAIAVSNLSDDFIVAVLPPGSIFLSQNRSVQNMVATRKSTVSLAVGETVSASIAVACANNPRAAPSSSDRLYLASELDESTELSSVLESVSAERLPFATRQALVWILTDNARLRALEVLNTMRYENVVSALTLLDGAGVDVESKMIWRDADTLLAGSSRASKRLSPIAAEWLWNRLGRPKTLVRARGASMLAVAATHGYMVVARELLAAGVPPDPTGGPGDKRVALRQAARGGHADLISLLIEAGADATSPGVFASAIRSGDPEIAQLVLEHGALPVSADPLLPDAARGKLELVRLLLDNGFDPNESDWLGTALHMARDEEVVRLLLQRGADVGARDRDGETPLFSATDAKLAALLGAGSDPNARAKDGSTALHKLVWVNGGRDSIRMLVEAGAEIDALDRKGMSPLHYAVQTKKGDAARVLLELGASDLPDPKGRRVASWLAKDERLREKLSDLMEARESGDASAPASDVPGP